jgi:hypothetical protein
MQTTVNEDAEQAEQQAQDPSPALIEFIHAVVWARFRCARLFLISGVRSVCSNGGQFDYHVFPVTVCSYCGGLLPAAD